VSPSPDSWIEQHVYYRVSCHYREKYVPNSTMCSYCIVAATNSRNATENVQI